MAGCSGIRTESLVRWDDYARDFWVRRIIDPRLTRSIVVSMKASRLVTPALRQIEDLLAVTAAGLLPSRT